MLTAPTTDPAQMQPSDCFARARECVDNAICAESSGNPGGAAYWNGRAREWRWQGEQNGEIDFVERS